jgi:hypothetical protein
VEYDHLFQSGDSVRAGLLERMPVIEKAATNGTTPVTNGNGAAAEENAEDLLEGLGGTVDILANKQNLKQPEVSSIVIRTASRYIQ